MRNKVKNKRAASRKSTLFKDRKPRK